MILRHHANSNFINHQYGLSFSANSAMMTSSLSVSGNLSAQDLTNPSAFGSYWTSSSFSLTSLVFAWTKMLLGCFLSTTICLLEAQGSLTSLYLSYISLAAARSPVLL